jgi:hypothetical protein
VGVEPVVVTHYTGLMSSASVSRQDASGHMPLGVCHNGRVLALVPRRLENDYGRDGRPGPALWDFITHAAAKHWLSPDDTELLQVCHLHPTSSAVDCLDCEPI